MGLLRTAVVAGAASTDNVVVKTTNHRSQGVEGKVRKLFQYGGIAASIVLIAFGTGSVYMGVQGRDTVRSELGREQIVGTTDSAIPGQKVDTGAEAKEF